MTVLRPISAVSRRLPGRTAFTLAELSVSMAIVGILVAAIGSVLVLASRAVDLNAATDPAMQAGDAADQIGADLAGAIAFPKGTTDRNSLTMTVPDRDGDGIPDTLVYEWSGVAGDPLTRQYLPSGGAAGQPVAIAGDVRELNFSTSSVSSRKPAYVESGPILLASHDGGGTAQILTLGHAVGCGQFFTPNSIPSLPSGSRLLSWRISRVRVYVRQYPNYLSTSKLSIEIRTPAVSSLPVDAVGLNESALPGNFNWYEASFTNMPSLAPTAGAWLIVRQTSSSGNAAQVAYDASIVGGNMSVTPNGDSNWQSVNPGQVYFQVYGYYTVALQ